MISDNMRSVLRQLSSDCRRYRMLDRGPCVLRSVFLVAA